MSGKDRFQSREGAMRYLQGIRGVAVSGKVVDVTKGSLVGIKRWGAIDYLRNYHNYSVVIN